MKLSQTGDHALSAPVFERLDEAGRLETRLKDKLAEIFDLWCEQNVSPRAEVTMLKRAV